MLAHRPGFLVEFFNESIPCGNRRLQLRPECGVLATVEIGDRYSLLLDPSVVAEIENTPPVHMRELDQMIIGDRLQVPSENFAGVRLVETAGIMPCEVGRALAVVQRGPVRGDGDDRVGRTEFEIQDVPIDRLHLPELDSAGELSPEKRRDVAGYTERLANGEQAPNLRGFPCVSREYYKQRMSGQLAAASEPNLDVEPDFSVFSS